MRRQILKMPTQMQLQVYIEHQECPCTSIVIMVKQYMFVQLSGNVLFKFLFSFVNVLEFVHY